MAVLAAVAVLSFLATPDGSSSSDQSEPTKAQLLSYAECMRAHGIRDFPDPVPAPGWRIRVSRPHHPWKRP